MTIRNSSQKGLVWKVAINSVEQEIRRKRSKDVSVLVLVNMELSKFNKEKRIEDARKIKSNLVQPLIRTIKERFKDYGDKKEVFDEMQIIDLEYWMNDKEHGNDKLIFLAYRFSILLAHADFNKGKALKECTKF